METMQATSYFCTGNAESKTVTLSNVTDYINFKIAHLVSSYMLVMNGVIITETVGKVGCTNLADAIINAGMMNKPAKELAHDYQFKLIDSKKFLN